MSELELLGATGRKVAAGFPGLSYQKTRYPLREAGFNVPDLEATPGFEPGVKDLQSSALPLGYVAKIGAEDGIRTRDLRLGKATLYH